jgi:mannose-6-phosphate isomerase-like protein (cupin superfamily)
MVTLASPFRVISASAASSIRPAALGVDTVSSGELCCARELDMMSSLAGTEENIDMATAQALETFDSQTGRTLHNRHTGERLHLRRVVRDGVVCLELKGSLPPRQDGPPLHVHYREYEEGTVVAGTLSAEVGGRILHVGPGGAAPLPIGVPHRWWNAGDEPLVFDGIAKPVVDLDVYLGAVFEVLNSGPANRPPVFYMAHLAWRHRKTQAVLFAPRWLQAIVVPVIVLVGMVLGRYRGTRWPGCPARCTPAPIDRSYPDVREQRTIASLA